MSAPVGFNPLPVGDLYFPEFTHKRSGPQGHEYWSEKRPREYLRVVYSNFARIETTHRFDSVERVTA